jgi:hypothetical protein
MPNETEDIFAEPKDLLIIKTLPSRDFQIFTLILEIFQTFFNPNPDLFFILFRQMNVPVHQPVALDARAEAAAKRKSEWGMAARRWSFTMNAITFRGKGRRRTLSDRPLLPRNAYDIVVRRGLESGIPGVRHQNYIQTRSPTSKLE